MSLFEIENLSADCKITDPNDYSKLCRFNLSTYPTSTSVIVNLPQSNTTLIGNNTSDTLTNKTINAPNNTITNISDTNISATATIDATKIANGTMTNTQFQSLATFSGSLVNVVYLTDVQTLTNKTINAPDNTITNIADANVASSASINATKIANGTMTNSQYQSLATVSTGNILYTTNSQTITNKTLTTSNVFADATDTTKQLLYNLSSLPTTKTITMTAPAISDHIIVTYPLTTTTLIGTNTTNTITNKILDTSNVFADATDTTKQLKYNLASIATTKSITMTAPVISSDIILTYPSITTTLIGSNTTNTITNKTLDTSNVFADATDTTKQLRFNLANLSTTNFITLSSPSLASNIVLTMPSTTSTLLGNTTTNTVTNKTLDTSNVFADATDTTKQLKFNLASIVSTKSITMVAPAIGGDINLTYPSITTTLIGDTTTNTLINKTMDAGSNTFTNFVNANISTSAAIDPSKIAHYKFYAYRSTVNTVYSTGTFDVLFDTIGYQSSSAFTLSNNEITINNTATYLILLDLSVETQSIDTNPGLNSAAYVTGFMQLDTGSGFANVADTVISSMNVSYGSINASYIKSLTATNKIKFQLTRAGGNQAITQTYARVVLLNIGTT